MDRRRAFTLVELTAVMAVLIILTAIAVPAFGRYLTEGRKTMEISAARKLIGGYLTAAADHDGYLLAGYESTDAQAFDAGGDPVHFPANARYPWRLAPYLDYDMNAILFNGNERALEDKTDFHYAASVSPNLGMNTVYVGGHYGSDSPLNPDSPKATSRYGSFCVQRLGQATRPGSLIVFASARRSKSEIGRFEIRPPAVTRVLWSGNWDPKAAAESFGYVDLRFNDHAVAAMLDGSVQLLDEDAIKDMRHWSNQAAEQDNPNFTITRIQ